MTIRPRNARTVKWWKSKSVKKWVVRLLPSFLVLIVTVIALANVINDNNIKKSTVQTTAEVQKEVKVADKSTTKQDETFPTPLDLRADKDPIAKSPLIDEVKDTSYKVQKGDSLWKIAEEHLGDGNKWKDIWEQNPDIEDPDLIYPGQMIVFEEVKQ